MISPAVNQTLHFQSTLQDWSKKIVFQEQSQGSQSLAYKQ